MLKEYRTPTCLRDLRWRGWRIHGPFYSPNEAFEWRLIEFHQTGRVHAFAWGYWLVGFYKLSNLPNLSNLSNL